MPSAELRALCLAITLTLSGCGAAPAPHDDSAAAARRSGKADCPPGAYCVYLPVISRPGRPVDAVNRYRQLAGVPLASDDAQLSDGAGKHAHYMVLNWDIPGGHYEDPGLPGYTPEGDLSARSSDLGWGYQTFAHAVEGWLDSFLHRLWMLDPALQRVGIGFEMAEPYKTGAVLDVLQGRGPPNPAAYPVAYPAAGQTAVPTDILVTLQFELWQPLTVSAISFTGPSGAVSCDRYDADGGVPPAIGLRPKSGLAPGATYTVSVGGTYRGASFSRSWSFSTAAAATATTTLATRPSRTEAGSAPRAVR